MIKKKLTLEKQWKVVETEREQDRGGKGDQQNVAMEKIARR